MILARMEGEDTDRALLAAPPCDLWGYLIAGWARVVTTEDNVLAMIEDTCRGRAPLFTQQHEVLELTGNAEAEQMEFRVRRSPTPSFTTR